MQALKTHLDMKDKESALLQRQVEGLHEDNERIAKMYQMVNQSSGKKSLASTDGDENLAPNTRSGSAGGSSAAMSEAALQRADAKRK